MLDMGLLCLLLNIFLAPGVFKQQQILRETFQRNFSLLGGIIGI